MLLYTKTMITFHKENVSILLAQSLITTRINTKYIPLKVDNLALVRMPITGFSRSGLKRSLTELARSPHRVTLNFKLKEHV